MSRSCPQARPGVARGDREPGATAGGGRAAHRERRRETRLARGLRQEDSARPGGRNVAVGARVPLHAPSARARPHTPSTVRTTKQLQRPLLMSQRPTPQSLPEQEEVRSAPRTVSLSPPLHAKRSTRTTVGPVLEVRIRVGENVVLRSATSVLSALSSADPPRCTAWWGGWAGRTTWRCDWRAGTRARSPRASPPVA
jgi:hypothetical protein